MIQQYTKVGFLGVTVLLFVSILFSCKHEPDSATVDCEVVGVTYENYVKFVIEDKCLGCHTNNSILPYQDTYSQVQAIANDGRLKNVLLGTEGYPIMPFQTEGLPDCTINNIISWIDNGAPE